MPCATAQSQRSGLQINTTADARPLAAGGGVLGALGLSGVVVPVEGVLLQQAPDLGYHNGSELGHSYFLGSSR